MATQEEKIGISKLRDARQADGQKFLQEPKHLNCFLEFRESEP
jgi:hypothetical protein